MTESTGLDVRANFLYEAAALRMVEYQYKRRHNLQKKHLEER